MLSFLPSGLRGSIALILHTLNTLLMCVPLFALALLKWLLPWTLPRRLINRLLNAVAGLWVDANNAIHLLTKQMKWEVTGVDDLRADDWYLVLANHQSWSDILVLQKVLNRRIPLLKFFLKQELLYVPVLGLAWWALDFPFMRRYTKSFLKKHPEMKGKDAETTRKACEKFRHIPITVMVFVEGTRLTEQKRLAQNSPFSYLLKPKSGGVGMVLQAMGDQFHRLLDITLQYDMATPSFWDFMCGRVSEVRVHVRSFDIPPGLLGDYENDAAYRAQFQTWLNALWADKDALLQQWHKLQQ